MSRSTQGQRARPTTASMPLAPSPPRRNFLPASRTMPRPDNHVHADRAGHIGSTPRSGSTIALHRPSLPARRLRPPSSSLAAVAPAAGGSTTSLPPRDGATPSPTACPPLAAVTPAAGRFLASLPPRDGPTPPSVGRTGSAAPGAHPLARRRPASPQGTGGQAPGGPAGCRLLQCYGDFGFWI